jgi:SAM-dependent methyltransferase
MESTNDRSREVNEYYGRVMDGHVYMRETIDAFLDVLGARIRRLGHAPRILELGCHAGVSTEWILERWPDADVVVQDTRRDLLAMAEERIGAGRVTLHAGPVETVTAPVDVVVSLARHHHLPHDYLSGVRGVLKAGGAYVLAEELCPEYCEGEHQARIAHAEELCIIGGYVLTSRAEIEAYRAGGTIPPHVLDLEQRRRHALWRWYRFVVDHAVERGYYDIAAAELQSARDDLVTGSDAEHKFSPFIVERQFALARFELSARRQVGSSPDPEHKSMVVYDFSVPALPPREVALS